MPTMSEIWHMFTIYDSLKLPHKKEKKKKNPNHKHSRLQTNYLKTSPSLPLLPSHTPYASNPNITSILQYPATSLKLVMCWKAPCTSAAVKIKMSKTNLKCSHWDGFVQSFGGVCWCFGSFTWFVLVFPLQVFIHLPFNTHTSHQSFSVNCN